MSDDIQALVDRLTATGGCTFVNITQYPGGLVDVMTCTKEGAVLFTERHTHEAIDTALSDVLAQLEELNSDGEKLRAALAASRERRR